MSEDRDFAFDIKGSNVKVHINEVPEKWLGDHDTVVSVKVDGQTVTIPDIWQAYQMSGRAGVELLVGAYLGQNTKT